MLSTQNRNLSTLRRGDAEVEASGGAVHRSPPVEGNDRLRVALNASTVDRS